MAVKIRLKRMGAKKRPFYRIVAADSRSPRDGRFIETLGTYNPIMEPAELTVKEDRIMYWLGVGAIPTTTVKNILSKKGLMEKFSKTKVKPAKKSKVAKEAKEPKKTVTAKKTTTKKAGK